MDRRSARETFCGGRAVVTWTRTAWGERLAAYVAAGGGLLLAAGPDVDGDVIADVLGGGTRLEIKRAAAETNSLAPADVRHPIFRNVGGDIASLAFVRFTPACA